MTSGRQRTNPGRQKAATGVGSCGSQPYRHGERSQKWTSEVTNIGVKEPHFAHGETPSIFNQELDLAREPEMAWRCGRVARWSSSRTPRREYRNEREDML